MAKLTIPRVLTVATLSLAGCSSPMPQHEAGADAPDGGAPVCRYDASRPANDPCESANLGSGICTFNTDADGGTECLYLTA